MSMVIPTQAYSLTLKPQPAPISVLGFSGQADISKLYEYRIEFTSPVADIPMDQVVGRPATFSIEPVDPDQSYLEKMFGGRWKDFSKMPSKHSTHGIIQRFENLGSSADETRYRVTLVPKIADLARARKSRLFQKQSVVEIITDTLRHYGYRLGVDFDFKGLRGNYRRFEYITQYHETTFAFIQRLCAGAGIWFRFEQKQDRAVIIFGDDLDAYARKQRVLPVRSHSGLESAGAESVRSLRTITQRVPEAIQLNDYNHRQADVSLLVEQNAAPGDPTTDGVDNHWGEHYETLEEGRDIARRRHEAHLATQITYRARGNPFALEVGEVVRLDVNPKDAPNGLLVTSIRCGGGRSSSYWTTFRAIPADRRWRTSIGSVAQPKIEGILPARVDSPGHYKYSYLTEKGLYVVKMPFDLDEWSPGGQSRAIRMAKPYAGADYGHHFPLTDGTEVALIFTGQDPNRPVIMGSLHDSLNPDLVNNLNNTRNLIRTAGRNELRMEDKEGIEHIHLSTPFQTSELNLGHMVDANRKERGRGAELRSDEHIAVRGGKGVLITAEVKPNASGTQLDVPEAMRQLQAAMDQAASLQSIAQAAQAELADVKAQQARLQNDYAELKKAVVLLSAPDGIVSATPADIQMSSGRHITATTGGNAEFSVVEKFTVAAGKAVSLLAQRLGLKLFAINGPVQVQAHSGPIELTANGDVIIKGKRLLFAGQEEVLISNGGGAFFKLADSQPQVGGSSNFLVKTPSISKAGAETAASVMPSFASGSFARKFFLHPEGDPDTPLGYHRFRVHLSDGSTADGVTDANGMSQLFNRDDVENLNIEVLGVTHD
ncbi:Rhs element Vgr protein [Caballeronia fortuita]|uniref:Rhs element Vgr protein n=1 Tax=Caballeronia fortuita TaxID=1777138 RepID=A0A158DSX5_9BURK|nr:type VI secretion system Vgr family protein [Caballeronia fortuita]SAK97685.1 Rhs element Vgr protein [Caballeronia fortuita]